MLTVSENGYGKRTSAYEYRISGRGGKGIIAMVVNQRNGKLVASFPVRRAIRSCWSPIAASSFACRSTASAWSAVRRKGVIVFSTAEDERVVAVEHIPDVENGDDGEDEAEAECRLSADHSLMLAGRFARDLMALVFQALDAACRAPPRAPVDAGGTKLRPWPSWQ